MSNRQHPFENPRSPYHVIFMAAPKKLTLAVQKALGIEPTSAIFTVLHKPTRMIRDIQVDME